MLIKSFMAYQNETDCYELNGLTIENRLDRVSLSGSIELTKDKEGLQNALELKRIIDASIEELRREKNLPDKIEYAQEDTIPNPFNS